jgi:hypothetical protein
MYTVGFVDNSFDLFCDYKKRLGRDPFNVQLLFPDAALSKEAILQWVLQNDISCLLVDYKLTPDFDYSGTDLVAYINGILPDLPCMILTAHTADSINEKLVIDNMIESRSSLDATDISGFVSKLKQAVDVFNNRLSLRQEEFTELLSKKKSGTITAVQDERLSYLYRVLRDYGMVDDIPVELLQSTVENKVDSLIGKITNLLTEIDADKAEKTDEASW